MPMKRLSENMGKGGTVYAGWLDHCRSDYVGFVDADGACPASEVARLISILQGLETNHTSTALFASRVKMLGRRVDRLFTRHLLGRVYATLVSELLDVPVYDSQCGLKIVPRRAYEAVAAKLQIKGFAFDVELMVALLDTGCQIEEVPIDWSEVPGGKVKLFRDSWRMARDVLRIRSGRSAWRL
jgi:glycosyltransferase involved in cell wall biosynthesis